MHETVILINPILEMPSTLIC